MIRTLSCVSYFLFQGIALKLLREYTDHVKKTQTGALNLILVCKAGLIPLYTKAGYTLLGKSNFAHGKLCDFTRAKVHVGTCVVYLAYLKVNSNSLTEVSDNLDRSTGALYNEYTQVHVIMS